MNNVFLEAKGVGQTKIKIPDAGFENKHHSKWNTNWRRTFLRCAGSRTSGGKGGDRVWYNGGAQLQKWGRKGGQRPVG